MPDQNPLDYFLRSARPSQDLLEPPILPTREKLTENRIPIKPTFALEFGSSRSSCCQSTFMRPGSWVEYPARRGESYSGTTWGRSGYFCSHIFRGKPRWHGDFDEKGLEKSIFALLDAVDRRFGVGLLQFTLGERPGFESVSNQSFGWSSHFGFRGATSMARVDCIQGSKKAIQPQ